jgi:hypothetical protein
VRLGESQFLTNLGEKVSKNPSQQTIQAWWHVSVVLAMQEAYVGGLQSKPNLGQKVQDPTQKITQSKKGRGYGSSGTAPV